MFSRCKSFTTWRWINIKYSLVLNRTGQFQLCPKCFYKWKIISMKYLMPVWVMTLETKWPHAYLDSIFMNIFCRNIFIGYNSFQPTNQPWIVTYQAPCCLLNANLAEVFQFSSNANRQVLYLNCIVYMTHCSFCQEMNHK